MQWDMEVDLKEITKSVLEYNLSEESVPRRRRALPAHEPSPRGRSEMCMSAWDQLFALLHRSVGALVLGAVGYGGSLSKKSINQY